MKKNDFIYNSDQVIEGETKWIAPSNIALVKYWGKKSIQLPKNPSISFTLSNCVTETKVIYTSKKIKDDKEVLNLIDNFLLEKNSFIFESVEKGSIRGRYTIIGFNPDKILIA